MIASYHFLLQPLGVSYQQPDTKVTYLFSLKLVHSGYGAHKTSKQTCKEILQMTLIRDF